MDTKKNSLGSAAATYHVSAAPWAMTSDAVEALMNQAASAGNWDLEALAAKTGTPLKQSRNIQMRGNTAVIQIIGPVFRYDSLWTRYLGLQTLEDLSKDFSTLQGEEFKDSVKKIILVFDSPGGQATGIAELADMIKRSKKPVIAYVDGMAASAAYWLASAASKIVVSKTAELGSIGAVMSVRTDRDGGVVRITSSQSPLKNAGPETEDGRNELQQRIDALAQIFIEDVAAYRNLPVETVLNDFGRGGIRMGEEAVKLGMADAVSTFEELVAG